MDSNTTLNLVTEVGVFGSLDMKDPTVTPVQDLYNKTNDPNLRAYLEEQMGVTPNKKGGLR
jgi:hypothetical protein